MEISKKEIFFKEVDMCQTIISRMNTNSFIIKWRSITLTLGFLAFNKLSDYWWNIRIVLGIFIVPILIFSFLDTYYLQQERAYRNLYNWIIKHREQTKDFLLDMNPKRCFDKQCSFLRVFFSKTVFPIYLLLFLIVIIYWLLLSYK